MIAGQSAGMKDEKPRADLNRPWRAIIKRAGLEGLRIHDLRHTHASIGAGLSLGLPIIGKLLHRNMPTLIVILCAAPPIALAIALRRQWG